MPNRDGTGPQGKGPMTGRVLGRCGPNNTNNSEQGFGRGFGFGRGQGRGQGLGFRNNTYLSELEKRIKDLEAKLKERDN